MSLSLTSCVMLSKGGELPSGDPRVAEDDDEEEDDEATASCGWMIGPTLKPSSRARRRLSPGCCTREGEAGLWAGTGSGSSSIETSFTGTEDDEGVEDDVDEVEEVEEDKVSLSCSAKLRSPEPGLMG